MFTHRTELAAERPSAEGAEQVAGSSRDAADDGSGLGILAAGASGDAADSGSDTDLPVHATHEGHEGSGEHARGQQAAREREGATHSGAVSPMIVGE